MALHNPLKFKVLSWTNTNIGGSNGRQRNRHGQGRQKGIIPHGVLSKRVMVGIDRAGGLIPNPAVSS